MNDQAVFERYEVKFLLTAQQKAALLETMTPVMALDQYGRDVIRNLYLDTDTYLLARRSLEKPLYKEKIRVRSYRLAGPESPVYVELKKKYEGVVHKRRVILPEEDAMAWVTGRTPPRENSQIAREISWFLRFYPTLRPRVYLSYEREAYFERDGGPLRITLDENILFRQEDLSLRSEPEGAPLLSPGHTLMEVKCAGGMPLWLTAFLSREKIYKTSFSKYGTAYQIILQGATDHDKRIFA